MNKRIIPCLLLSGQGIVKTIKFKNLTYIGDPINTVKIFNDKFVDELMIFDIDAQNKEKSPNFDFIEEIVSEAFMPVCYGGGIKNISHLKILFNCGVEKVSINSEAIYNPSVITEAASIFGSQSIVATIDIKKQILSKKYTVTGQRGTKNLHIDPLDYAIELERLGAGELVVNNVSRDGTMKGLDLEIISKISESVNIPTVAVGGTRDLQDIKRAFSNTSVSAISAGSIFVYHGPKKAVLINYPHYEDLELIKNNRYI